MPLKSKKAGPDLFLEILLHGKHSQNYGEELHENLTNAFHTIANHNELPVPYNYEFVQFISENSGENLFKIEERYGPIISAPQDFDTWQRLHMEKLMASYQNWLDLKKQHHIFSFFVLAQSSAGFVGALRARIERDAKNIPDNHITGSSHPPTIKQTVLNSFHLVRYYLISGLKIPNQAVQESLRTVVIQWEESLLSHFTDISGSSLSFLFSSLFFACALQNLMEDGIVEVSDNKTGKKLRPVEIQIPSDTITSGSFKYNKIPNEFIWNETYKEVPSKEVGGVIAKMDAALGVKMVDNFFSKCLLPYGVRLNGKGTLEDQYVYSNGHKNISLSLIPIKNIDEMISQLFPVTIKVVAYKTSSILQERPGLDFHEVDLSHANFSGRDIRGANLAKANLTGANLTGTNLTGANLTGANLTGADLTGANLRGADLKWSDLTKTVLKDTDLRGANFRGAHFNWTNLKEADLRGSNFKKTQLRNTDLGKANLTGSDLGQVDFKKANLTGAELRGAEFKGAEFEKVDLVNTCLKQVDFAEANLRESDLTGADLSGSNLQRVNLTKANCIQANFERANLTGANLSDANLTGAHLVGAVLVEANLQRADFTEANLTMANLVDTNLKGADLTEANLTEANLHRANLIDVDLTKANLERANLTETQLTGIFLTKSILRETKINNKAKQYLEQMATKEQIRLSDVVWVKNNNTA